MRAGPRLTLAALLLAGCDAAPVQPPAGPVVLSHIVSPTITTVATGLNNPRGLRFGPDGNL